MKKSQLKKIIKETLEEVKGKPMMVNGVPVTFSISGHQDRISIHIYHGRELKKTPFNAGAAILYRPNEPTNLGHHFYKEDAQIVAKGLKQKFGVSVRWVPQREFHMDYPKNRELGPTGKEIYWLVIEYPQANSLLSKLFQQALQS